MLIWCELYKTTGSCNQVLGAYGRSFKGTHSDYSLTGPVAGAPSMVQKYEVVICVMQG